MKLCIEMEVHSLTQMPRVFLIKRELVSLAQAGAPAQPQPK